MFLAGMPQEGTMGASSYYNSMDIRAIFAPRGACSATKYSNNPVRVPRDTKRLKSTGSIELI